MIDLLNVNLISILFYLKRKNEPFFYSIKFPFLNFQERKKTCFKKKFLNFCLARKKHFLFQKQNKHSLRKDVLVTRIFFSKNENSY